MRCLLSRFVLVALVLSAVGVAGAEGVSGEKIKFKKTVLDNRFRSEGVAVGDFNKDGKLDIAAGPNWYAAPKWEFHTCLDKEKSYDPHGYSNSFCTYADDVNGDGWTDILYVDFPGADTFWLENPKNGSGAWVKRSCVSVTNNESPTFLDLDGDGKRELIQGFAPDPKNFDGPDRRMGFVKPGSDVNQPWTVRGISAKGAPRTTRFSHGLGVGDVNKDGRLDMLVPEGWWEHPADKNQAEWTFHKAPFGADCANMHVYDFDGDGDNDVISSAAHQIGLWWHEKTKDGWKTHEIGKPFSQTHAMCFHDINQDGLPDLITGKRYWAHGPNGDVDPGAPAMLAWFELSRKDGKPVWTQRTIDNDSGVGTQFEVSDVNGDKLLDVVIANKKGVFYFEQIRDAK